MKCDVILAGVGGQGVLSVAAIIAQAAVSEGYKVRQSEVHGMAQRGGGVLARLRISGGEVACGLVPKGGAGIIISMEPLESLRYAAWLAPSGVLVTAAEPFVNIANYPDMGGIIAAVNGFPIRRIIEAAALAKEAGLPRTVNTVMVGAASPFLPIKAETLENTVSAVFAVKGAQALAANILAFNLGKKASEAAGGKE
jgi:indolepyruvate ferredoxin oxidoreductase beta subunit